MSRLEELCRPFLTLVCSHVVFSLAGANVNAEDLRAKARATLDAIREACAGDAVLRREFERIEKPLVFFADYCLKEGAAPLAREWSELGRSYSELSGDEKFYDMLAATLEDPEASERLRMFYLMMGLGFDGVHRGDGGYIRQRMRLCATRFDASAGERAAHVPDLAATHVGACRRSRLLAGCLVLACLFAAGAFASYYYRFCRETRDYRSALVEAHRLAEADVVARTHFDDLSESVQTPAATEVRK